MDATAFKYKYHYPEQNQHFATRNNNNNNAIISGTINSNNHKSQNSIYILNTATNNCYYSDINDKYAVSLPSSSAIPSATTPSSSVWSSASSNMCSPAAQALQKLFSCSSGHFKLNHGTCGGIESKTFKSKSEILKKKAKFWKYLEGEDNDKNHQRGIERVEKTPTKSFKFKSTYWSKSYENENENGNETQNQHQNQEDLSALLEYSCSLCENCRCMDCQIGYFDCENSDDSSSEYSFNLSPYEEDDADGVDSDNDNLQPSYESCCNSIVSKQQAVRKLNMDSKLLPNCSLANCACNELNCCKFESCQECCIGSVDGDVLGPVESHQEYVARQHY